MQKTILFIFFLTITFLKAQSSSILYELIYKPSTDSKDTATKSAVYYLDILNRESVFRSDFRRQSDSLIKYGGGLGFGYSTNIGEQIYLKKDYNKDKAVKYVVSPVSRDKFYIVITEKLNWKILPETQIIGSLKCQKATTDYGGRFWTAWFTQDIQLSEGPYVFHGLPGLIVQISDSNEEYSFKLVKIKKFSHKSLFPLIGGREISWETFTKIRRDYYIDPYAFIKANNLKAGEDDGNGGIKRVENFREWTLRTQENLRKNDNMIELNQKIDYK